MKTYTVMGSCPDGGIAFGNTPEEAFSNYQSLSCCGDDDERKRIFDECSEFLKVNPMVKVGERSWKVGDYEVKEITDGGSRE